MAAVGRAFSKSKITNGVNAGVISLITPLKILGNTVFSMIFEKIRPIFIWLAMKSVGLR